MFNESKIMFWPVGTGDSTTIVIKKDIVLQVDIRNLEKADNDEDDHVSIVDVLVDNLVKVDNEPYLDGFALTHPDKDHILGFKELLEKVTIAEIWFTPRVFAEYDDDLCDDAQAFKDEAYRRVKATIDAKGNASAGDRVRIIGYDDLLEEDDFNGFPEDRITVPGNSLTELDGVDYESEFNVFIHAPFKEETEGERNNTSLAMQVTLGNDPSAGGVLLFGDIAYPRIRQIFDETKDAENEDFLKWKVFLAPHHCSKSAMYQDENGREVLKQDMLDDLDSHQVGDGYIVSSSEKIPAENKKGDNPPHAKAKERYEEVAEGEFLCTHENGETGEPLVFEFEEDGLSYSDEDADASVEVDNIAIGVETARGSEEPPAQEVGFG